MPTISIFYGILISMFYDDHAPPHFHAKYAEFGGVMMYWDVVEVTPKSDLTLLVRFSDGTAGSVRFLPSHFTGVFAPLKSGDFFKRVFIDNGAVTWPGEIDLAPDAMYDEIKKNGEWVLK